MAQEEYQKAFEAVMIMNYEFLESNRLLRECIGEDLPLQQNDKILDQRVIKGFGTGSVNEARRMVEESWRDYQQDVQQEPVEEMQRQSQGPRDFSEPYPQAGQPSQQPKEGQYRGESKSGGFLGLYEGKEPPHHTAVREQVESRGKSGGLLELYEDKEPLHHEAERGRAENRGLNFNKKSGLTPGD